MHPHTRAERRHTNVTNKEIKFTRDALYQDYLDELVSNGYIKPTSKWPLNSPYTDGKGAEEFYMKLNEAEWLPLTKEGEEVGFIIICQAPECHPLCDFFISQTYVAPEYRRSGLASKVFKSFSTRHPGGKYCLDVIKENDAAKAFWNKVFREIRYSRINNIKDVPGRLEENEETWYFGPNGN